MRYKLTIDFEDLNDLKEFVTDSDLIENIKLKKTFKKPEGDKRGLQTSK